VYYIFIMLYNLVSVIPFGVGRTVVSGGARCFPAKNAWEYRRKLYDQGRGGERRTMKSGEEKEEICIAPIVETYDIFLFLFCLSFSCQCH